MNTQETNTNSPIRQQADDEISLKELLLKIGNTITYLKSKWLLLAAAVLIGAVLGLVFSLLSKPKYTSQTTFVLEEEKGSGNLGQMAGLASMVGINLGGMEGAGLFSGDNIMEFLRSRRMIYKTLLTQVEIEGEQMLLADRYVAYNELSDKWQKEEQLKGFRFITDTSDVYLQDSILNTFYKDIVKNVLTIEKPDKKLNIISLEVETPDEQFSKAFNETLIQNASDFYIQTRTKKSSENLAVLNKQVDSVRRELNKAIGGVAMASQANPNANPAFQTLRVASQERQVDVQANTAILTQLVQQQELAKITLRNSKPLIQVLDRPYLPLEETKVGKKKGMVIGGFLLGFLAVLFLLAKRMYRSIMLGE